LIDITSTDTERVERIVRIQRISTDLPVRSSLRVFARHAPNDGCDRKIYGVPPPKPSRVARVLRDPNRVSERRGYVFEPAVRTTRRSQTLVCVGPVFIRAPSEAKKWYASFRAK